MDALLSGFQMIMTPAVALALLMMVLAIMLTKFRVRRD